MWETFETPFYQQRMIDVTYSAQGIFKNLIGVCALRAVGHICGNIAVTDRVLVPDVPLGGKGGIVTSIMRCW